MGVPIRLEAVLEAMDLPTEWESFLDPATGKIVTLSEDDQAVLDDEDADVDEFPDWQRDSITEIRKVLDSGRALRLPDSFDINEWDLMRRFSSLLEDPEQRRELLDAIHGTGAFRIFKMSIARLGLRERWFEYRDNALRRIAKDWLETEGIPFVEDAINEAL